VVHQRQLYLEDTYLAAIATTVVAGGDLDGRPWVRLRDNIFHPQGGGQPADTGALGPWTARPRRDPEDPSWVVLDLHGPDGARPDASEVVTTIDLDLRCRHAALHTAGHVIDALMQRRGFRHVANNHFPGQARVEYDLQGQGFDPETLHVELTAGLEEAIAARLTVRAQVADGMRTVTIDGLGTEPCGGTHVPDLGRLAATAIRSLKVKGGRLRVGYTAEHVPLGTP